MTGLGLTAGDVVDAIRDQNIQVFRRRDRRRAGPARPAVPLHRSAPRGRLSDVEDFENIVIRARPDGSTVTVGEVADVELGAQTYSWYGGLDGKPAALLAIYQQPEANALDVAKAVEVELDRLAQRFPDDLEYDVTYDTTHYVETSMAEVAQTLFIAVVPGGPGWSSFSSEACARPSFRRSRFRSR